ncbi:MAG: AcvB/VirJ family lysyl-phosphatidylglycerol hydrolase [Pseudomonadota bacterium]
MRRLAWLMCVLSTLPLHAAEPQTLDHGRFEKVRIYKPTGTTRSVVLFLSGDGGWKQQEAKQAEAMVAEGAVVIGIDTPQFMAALEADGGECVFPDGDLENLSRFVQAYAKLPGYRAPLLAGYSAGAALAYASLAQAPTGTFSGGLVTGFKPDLDLRKPLCPGDGLAFEPLANGKGVDFLARRDLAVPFLALLGERDAVCDAATTQAFIQQMPAARQKLLKGVGHDYGGDARGRMALAAALRSLSAVQKAVVPPAPNDLGDLPVVEEPANPGTPATPYVALFWSGDGGWAGIDKEVSDALNARGVPVVGVDSLRYFWTARTPEGIARDIEKISRHYLAAWNRQKVILIGYSQGADVLPFAVNRLGPALRAQVAMVAAMGLSDHAVFEFELGNWVSDNNNGPETLPEVARIKTLPFICIYGEEETDSICPRLVVGDHVRVVKMPGGHHFDGDYEKLATTILGALPAP